MMDILLRFGATDSDSGALRAAAAVNNDKAVAKLLSLKAHKDSENKVHHWIMFLYSERRIEYYLIECMLVRVFVLCCLRPS